MTSGAFTAAYQTVIPEFERATRNTIATTYGGRWAMRRIDPRRLERGSRCLSSCSPAGRAHPAGQAWGEPRDLARSSIGIAVRAGLPGPTSVVDRSDARFFERNR